MAEFCRDAIRISRARKRVTGVISEGDSPHRLPGLLPIITCKVFSKMAHMKKQNFAGLVVGLCLSTAPLVGHAQANHVNIMRSAIPLRRSGPTRNPVTVIGFGKNCRPLVLTILILWATAAVVADGDPAQSDFDQGL